MTVPIQPGPGRGYRIGGRYELTEPIATGGMARVWRAIDTVLGRPVAVKILHPHLATDQGFLIRFQREAVAAARLSHPSIVAIYDTVSHRLPSPTANPAADGIEAIVMELVDGQTLRDVLDRTPILPIEDVLHIGRQVAEALNAAHLGGVVHRDIKPSNILLCEDRRVMVTDFGIAKAGEDTDLTVTGTLLGTAKYLSPEQVRGEDVDPRSDLYALGVVLYEALAGVPPFKAETDAATALSRLHTDPLPLADHRPDAPVDLQRAVMRLLAREPDRRFDRALDVRAALSAIGTPDDGSPPLGHAATSLDPTLIENTTATNVLRRSPDQPDLDQYQHNDYQHNDVAEEPTVSESNGFVRSERSWLIPALVVLLLAGALMIAAALFSRSPLASSSNGGKSDPAASDASSDGAPSQIDQNSVGLAAVDERVEAGIVDATTFDPEGDGEEGPATVRLAFDGDDESAWRTETYNGPGFGGLKSGVGILLDLGGTADISAVELTTTTIAWSIDIYVGDDFTGPTAAWGAPVATARFTGDTNYDLDFPTAEGRFVLLWVTDHGISESRDDLALPAFRFELAEVSVS